MSTELSIHEDQSVSDRTGAMIEVAQSRQAQEVQAMIILSKKFPRDETDATTRIVTACKRKKLAESAMYQYARGGTNITGPSIRLAECMAQCWGNMDYGVIELEQSHGESHMMSYAWDMETNTRRSMVFTVKHLRSTKQGTYALTDPRDIYEQVANQGARRLRACILAVIPKDIQDLAVEQCEKTQKEGNTEPLIDRIRKMVSAFHEIGVTQVMIEKRVQRNVDACNEQNLLDLRKIYTSLRDGMSSREEWFDFDTSESAKTVSGESKTERVAKGLKKKAEQSRTQPAPSTPSPPPSPPAPEKVAEDVPSDAGYLVYPAELNDYVVALQAAKNEDDVRAVWGEHVLAHKDSLPSELYILGNKLRDQRRSELSTDAAVANMRGQGTLPI